MTNAEQGSDLHQTAWCVQYRYRGNRSADRKYFHREWTARRYANRILKHPNKYPFVDLQKRPVGKWRTVDRIHQGPIVPIDWDQAWAQRERKKRS